MLKIDLSSLKEIEIITEEMRIVYSDKTHSLTITIFPNDWFDNEETYTLPAHIKDNYLMIDTSKITFVDTLISNLNYVFPYIKFERDYS